MFFNHLRLLFPVHVVFTNDSCQEKSHWHIAHWTCPTLRTTFSNSVCNKYILLDFCSFVIQWNTFLQNHYSGKFRKRFFHVFVLMHRIPSGIFEKSNLIPAIIEMLMFLKSIFWHFTKPLEVGCFPWYRCQLKVMPEGVNSISDKSIAANKPSFSTCVPVKEILLSLTTVTARVQTQPNSRQFNRTIIHCRDQ